MKGLYASKIEFGTSAFDENDQTRLLVIATKAVVATSCNTVCGKHGLLCFAVYSTTGKEVTPPVAACANSYSGLRYCWCD